MPQSRTKKDQNAIQFLTVEAGADKFNPGQLSPTASKQGSKSNGLEDSVDLSQEEMEFDCLNDYQKFKLLADKHRFIEKGKIVHMGIIDYLTKYNCAKAVERKFRSMQAPELTVSVAPPVFYGQRFQAYMRQNVFKDEEG